MSKKVRVVNQKKKQSEASNEHQSEEEDDHGFRGYYMSIVVETRAPNKTTAAAGDKIAFRPVPLFRSCVQFWPNSKVDGASSSSSSKVRSSSEGLENASSDEDFDDDEAEELSAEEFTEELGELGELGEGELELLIREADPPDLGASVRKLLATPAAALLCSTF